MINMNKYKIKFTFGTNDLESIISKVLSLKIKGIKDE